MQAVVSVVQAAVSVVPAAVSVAHAAVSVAQATVSVNSYNQCQHNLQSVSAHKLLLFCFLLFSLPPSFPFFFFFFFFVSLPLNDRSSN